MTLGSKSHGKGRVHARLAIACVLVAGAWLPALALGEAPHHGSIAAPAQKPAETNKPAGPTLTCTLITTEAPRGGRLEVEGANFGKAPLVKIAGRITRMIERTETKIAVQIPRDSDGGPVTVHAGKEHVECGTLTIIGKNG